MLQIIERIGDLEKKQIGAINYGLEKLRLRKKRLQLEKHKRVATS